MKTQHTKPIFKRQQHGFSLLEVLIALAVLSVGLLGLAALQTVGLRMGHDSYQRTQATMLAYDMADRMRANPVAVAAGTYNGVTELTSNGTTDCVTTTCTPTDLANYDIRSWHTIIADKLSQGEGTITLAGTLRTIEVSWLENDLRIRLKIQVQL